MVTYDVDELRGRVRRAMDESVEGVTSLMADYDDQDLNLLIRDKLRDAVQLVHMSAPAGMVEGKPLGVAPEREQDGSGFVVLPGDFMRLVLFQMQGWKRPVTEPMGDDHPDYILQKNRFVRGGPDKPVCVLTVNDAGKKILEYYSVPDGNSHVIAKGIYLPWPEIETSIRLDPNGGRTQVSNIAVCPRLVTSVVYMAAGLVYTALNELQRADYLMNLSKTYMI